VGFLLDTDKRNCEVFYNGVSQVRPFVSSPSVCCRFVAAGSRLAALIRAAVCWRSRYTACCLAGWLCAFLLLSVDSAPKPLSSIASAAQVALITRACQHRRASSSTSCRRRCSLLSAITSTRPRRPCASACRCRTRRCGKVALLRELCRSTSRAPVALTSSSVLRARSVLYTPSFAVL
jgi:hypothetical protein